MPQYFPIKGASDDSVQIGVMDAQSAFKLCQSPSIWTIDKTNKLGHITIDTVIVAAGISPWSDTVVKVNAYLKKKKGWTIKISPI